MDINVNINVNSQPLVEASNRLKETNKSAVELNDTLKDRTPESQISRNTNEITRSGRAMTGLKTAVTGFDKLVGSEIGGATETVGALGQTFVGLGRALPLVTTAFRAMGAALMSNPIFLIGAAISGLVVVIGGLLQAFGFLQPLIDGISSLVSGLVEGFMSLARSIGLASDEMDDGKKSAEEYKKALEGVNEATDKSLADIRRRIDLGKAQGKSLNQLLKDEIEYNVVAGNASIDREQFALNEIKKYQEKIDALDFTNKSALEKEKKYNEEISKLNKDVAAEIKLREDNNLRIKVIKIEAEKEAADKAIEYNKKVEENSKKTDEERRKRARKELEDLENFEKTRIEISKRSILAQTQLIVTREAELNIFNKKKELQKDLGISDSELALSQQVVINKTEELTKKIKELNDSFVSRKDIIATGITLEYDFAEAQQKIIDKYKSLSEISSLQLQEEDKTYSERISKINSFYDIQKKLLEAQKALELTNAEETGANIELINEKYRILNVENEKKKAEQIKQINKATADGALDSAESVLNAFSSLSDAFFSIKKSNLQKGSKEEEKAAREEFEVRKKMSIAGAIISGIQGVVNILSAPSILPIEIASVYKGIQVAALAVTTAAQIAKISSQQFESPSSSTSAPSTPSTSAATPSFNLFGQGNQMNVSSAQPTTTVSDPQGNVLRVVAEVSETEITAVQMRNRRYSNSAEL